MKTYTSTLDAAVLTRLCDYAALFADDFPQAKPATWAGVYLQGLLLDGERKSVEPLARRVTLPDGLTSKDPEQALQQFINQSPWDEHAVLRPGSLRGARLAWVPSSRGDGAIGLRVLAVGASASDGGTGGEEGDLPGRGTGGETTGTRRRTGAEDECHTPNGSKKGGSEPVLTLPGIRRALQHLLLPLAKHDCTYCRAQHLHPKAVDEGCYYDPEQAAKSIMWSESRRHRFKGFWGSNLSGIEASAEGILTQEQLAPISSGWGSISGRKCTPRMCETSAGASCCRNSSTGGTPSLIRTSILLHREVLDTALGSDSRVAKRCQRIGPRLRSNDVQLPRGLARQRSLVNEFRGVDDA